MGFWDAILGGLVTTTTTTRVIRAEGPLRQAVEQFKMARALETLSSGSRPAENRERVRSEIFMIAPNFSKHEGICYDVANCDWLIIPRYPLPAKFASRWAKLLIVFPETYPTTPPIGFYLNRKFQLVDGSGTDSHLIGRGLHTAPDLQRLGWQWYCVQAKESSAGGWRPSAQYDKPDNLRSFLSLVREVLTND
jgi:hypothetical protein